MDNAYSLVPYGGRIRDFVQTELTQTFAYDLLSEFKLHCRVQQAREDTLIMRYINMALRTIENILHKDIFPRTVTCRWMAGGKLFISAGEIRNLTLRSGTSPDEVDMFALVNSWGDTSFRGGGLFLGYTNNYAPVLEASDADLYLAFETGFLEATDIPDEVIFAAMEIVAFAYVNREIAGVGTVAFTVDFIPQNVLGPLTRMVIA